jgi:hypothetical protein
LLDEKSASYSTVKVHPSTMFSFRPHAEPVARAMKLALVIAVGCLFLSAGCVPPPRASDPQAKLAPNRFDLITLGMTRGVVIEVLGAPKSETEQGHLKWEDRYDSENYDSLEVGFDEAGKAIFIENTKRKHTSHRT